PAPSSLPSPAAGAASPAAVPPAAPPSPPVEILRAPEPVEPAKSQEPGISAVRDVTLGGGVPELTRGRRPTPPPFARMAGVTGAVLVRFSIDASGATSVQGSEGPDLLKPAAEQV